MHAGPCGVCWATCISGHVCARLLQAHVRCAGSRALARPRPQEHSEQQRVLQDLFRPSAIRAEDGVRLLYVTPERLGASPGLQNALRAMHRNRQLKRFVIDEAHCVSQWGHDFRPDYANLGILKHNFPDVPLIALTATATERVRMDVTSVLRISGCPVFTSSFNRPNLWYHVKPKKKQCAEEIGAIVRDRHVIGV
jgi:bloom syndrome protein